MKDYLPTCPKCLLMSRITTKFKRIEKCIDCDELIKDRMKRIMEKP